MLVAEHRSRNNENQANTVDSPKSFQTVAFMFSLVLQQYTTAPTHVRQKNTWILDSRSKTHSQTPANMIVAGVFCLAES